MSNLSHIRKLAVNKSTTELHEIMVAVSSELMSRNKNKKKPRRKKKKSLKNHCQYCQTSFDTKEEFCNHFCDDIPF